MSDEITPALTPEEWTTAYYGRDVIIHQKTPGLDGSRRLHVEVTGHPIGGSMGDQRDFHALAALCLVGQPFGFSADDLNVLDRACPSDVSSAEMDAFDRGIASLRSRIASLLPPPSPGPTT